MRRRAFGVSGLEGGEPARGDPLDERRVLEEQQVDEDALGSERGRARSAGLSPERRARERPRAGELGQGDRGAERRRPAGRLLRSRRAPRALRVPTRRAALAASAAASASGGSRRASRPRSASRAGDRRGRAGRSQPRRRGGARSASPAAGRAGAARSARAGAAGARPRAPSAPRVALDRVGRQLLDVGEDRLGQQC